jgi:anti-sigma factor RsiW
MAPPRDLTASILARTSGVACPRLRDLACDFVDGALDVADARLVEGHAAHCPTCTALLETLRAAHLALPALAELEPGPFLVTRVRQACQQTRSPGPWARLLQRPRLALEGALLGATLLMLVQVATPATLGVATIARGLHSLASVIQLAKTEPSDPALR